MAGRYAGIVTRCHKAIALAIADAANNSTAPLRQNGERQGYTRKPMRGVAFQVAQQLSCHASPLCRLIVGGGRGARQRRVGTLAVGRHGICGSALNGLVFATKFLPQSSLLQI